MKALTPHLFCKKCNSDKYINMGVLDLKSHATYKATPYCMRCTNSNKPWIPKQEVVYRS